MGSQNALTVCTKHEVSTSQGQQSGKNLENPVASLNKEVRVFNLGDNSIGSFPSVSSLSDYSIWRPLAAILAFKTLAFGAFPFIVPTYYYRLGKMGFKESSLLIWGGYGLQGKLGFLGLPGRGGREKGGSIRIQKGSHKARKSHEQRQRIFWTVRGGYRSLPIKTRVLRQIAPQSSSESSAKPLSLKFFQVPFLSLRFERSF